LWRELLAVRDVRVDDHDAAGELDREPSLPGIRGKSARADHPRSTAADDDHQMFTDLLEQESAAPI
jgi:hypothetical protein